MDWRMYFSYLCVIIIFESEYSLTFKENGKNFSMTLFVSKSPCIDLKYTTLKESLDETVHTQNPSELFIISPLHTQSCTLHLLWCRDNVLLFLRQFQHRLKLRNWSTLLKCIMHSLTKNNSRSLIVILWITESRISFWYLNVKARTNGIRYSAEQFTRRTFK